MHSVWEKRCLRASAGLNHELLKVVDEQQNEVRLWAVVLGFTKLTRFVDHSVEGGHS